MQKFCPDWVSSYHPFDDVNKVEVFFQSFALPILVLNISHI